MNNNNTSAILFSLVVFLLLKEPMKALLPKLLSKIKSKRPSPADSILGLLVDSLSQEQERRRLVNNELNHIKGQLQDISQANKKLAESLVPVNQNANAEANQVYLQALASLAKGSEKVMERQEKIETLLVQLVGSLNKLTSSL